MAKKQVRNKFRDRIGDYYLINRQITKADDARYAREKHTEAKAPWSKKEKAMAIITGIALVLLAVRLLFFG